MIFTATISQMRNTVTDYLIGVGQPMPVVDDPRNAAPPCVLILPNIAAPRTMRDMVRLEIGVQVIAPGPAHGDALAFLDNALFAVWEALGRKEASLVGYESPHTGQMLLAYEMTYIQDTGVE